MLAHNFDLHAQDEVAPGVEAGRMLAIQLDMGVARETSMAGCAHPHPLPPRNQTTTPVPVRDPGRASTDDVGDRCDGRDRTGCNAPRPHLRQNSILAVVQNLVSSPAPLVRRAPTSSVPVCLRFPSFVPIDSAWRSAPSS